MKFFDIKNIFTKIDDAKNFTISKNDELDEKQENILENNIIWIFSPPRSGTTWLKELLSDQCHVIDEPLIGYHVIGSSRDEAVQKRLIDDHRKRDDYFFSERYKQSWKMYLRKMILMRIYAQVHDVSKKIVIKEPNGSMGADILLDCMPKSKFIYIVRDGRDVIDSLMDARMEGSWASNKQVNNTRESRLKFITRQSDIWIKHITNLSEIYKKFPNDQKYLLKYEDLRNDTLKEIKNLYRFFDIDDTKIEKSIKKYDFGNISPKMKGKTKPRRFATPGKWKQNLNEEEQNELNKRILSKVKEFGYD